MFLNKRNMWFRGLTRMFSIALAIMTAFWVVYFTFSEATNMQVLSECFKVPIRNAGSNDVKTLIHTDDNKLKSVDYSRKCPLEIERRTRTMTASESEKAKQCIQTSIVDLEKSHDAFWSGDTQYFRRKHHKYMTSSSIVIDVGDDAEAIFNSYNTHTYVVIVPLYSLYQILVNTFKTRSNVFVYNFGTGESLRDIYVHLKGNPEDATSAFKDAAKTGCFLKVDNTTDFLLQVGVGCFEVDLLTINCHGCEYPILEHMLSSNIISSFKHIQFSTHTKEPGLHGAISRYCEIQELLSRTHVLSYQYKFIWETWIRKDILLSLLLE